MDRSVGLSVVGSCAVVAGNFIDEVRSEVRWRSCLHLRQEVSEVGAN